MGHRKVKGLLTANSVLSSMSVLFVSAFGPSWQTRGFRLGAHELGDRGVGGSRGRDSGGCDCGGGVCRGPDVRFWIVRDKGARCAQNLS